MLGDKQLTVKYLDPVTLLPGPGLGGVGAGRGPAGRGTRVPTWGQSGEQSASLNRT